MTEAKEKIRSDKTPYNEDTELGTLLTLLIADELEIEPSEVTTEFIHHWREEHLYPAAPVTTSTKYGGYVAGGKRLLTQDQLAAQDARSQEFLREIMRCR